MKILIVEDDEPMALIMSTLMRSMGKICMVKSLRDAKECVVDKTTDLVMLDLNLPDSTMRDTLRQIRKLKESVPKVVVMTGAYLPDITQLVIEAGADACFYKGDANFISWLKDVLRPGSKTPFTPQPVS